MTTLGIDTSNYTTSAAVYNPEGACLNAGRLLDVPEGSLGLRQSDALFAHVKRLPEQFLRLEQAGVLENIQHIAVLHKGIYKRHRVYIFAHKQESVVMKPLQLVVIFEIIS